ncbi:lipoyl(octanoyl) transferase LipB [Pusillimonas sp. TS35]|uniref:lipoyl(octanoyl) transferase LipB n=1 Tax=Paracandidimonas lactea TaxID=2895524 RepID=UPI001368AAC6|nr:lipoyl(octanoyl) transferase LipB [Paracandidimonas lactea]MYN13982.1 lipoyl(octanoyl) transferase LipB [Pusillimonas sp. TS35]
MIEVKWLPRPSAYLPVWEAMRDFTERRDADTPDQIWLVEHEPVYTLGQAGKPVHVLNAGSIDVVHTDRGGQVTYHGPGQVVAYCLVDLRRHGLFVKEYVALLEDVLIAYLDSAGVPGACRKAGAPGVYVPGEGGELAKIAALGIKVRNGCTYHGLALNVDMDLSPFLGINPCGYEGLETVDMRSHGVSMGLEDVGNQLANRLAVAFNARMKAAHAALVGGHTA